MNLSLGFLLLSWGNLSHPCPFVCLGTIMKILDLSVSSNYAGSLRLLGRDT